MYHVGADAKLMRGVTPALGLNFGLGSGVLAPVPSKQKTLDIIYSARRDQVAYDLSKS